MPLSLGAVDSFEDLLSGEHSCRDYAGPWDAECTFNRYRQNSELNDELYRQSFSLSSIDPALVEWKSWMESALPQGNLCPWDEFVRHHDYIRYLYRLIVMSYLFETVNLYAEVADKGSNQCKISWKELLESCAPESEEMGKFIFRAKLFLKGDEELKKAMGGEGKEFASRRLGKKLGASLSEADKNLLNQACEADQKLFKNICNEEDHFFGVSRMPELLKILKESNALSVINRHGYGPGCLQMFTQLYRNKEVALYSHEEVFSALAKKLSDHKQVAYKEGGLFLPGALKVFDDKGLQDFLFQTPTPTPTPVAQVVVATATPVATARETEEKVVVVPTVRPTVAPTATPVELSAFETAVQKLEKEKVDYVDVDMQKLRSEFVLDPEKEQIIKELLTDFQTREGLKDMKDYDQLGSLSVPIRLLFVKFLVEHDEHQGLFNIQSVIGKRFYLLNDLDKKEVPKIAELLSPEQTERAGWGIRLRKVLVDPTPIPTPTPVKAKAGKPVPVRPNTGPSKEEREFLEKKNKKKRFKELLDSLEQTPTRPGTSAQ